MSAPLVLVLGNKNLSSWSLRPWLAMRHSGIPFGEHVFLFEEEGWRDRIAPLAPSRKVPALRHGDRIVWDSLAICEYVAELHPDARLWPEDAHARAVARSASAEMHSGFAALRRELSMDVTARLPRPTLSHDALRDVERIQTLWQECRSRFGSGGPFLFGRFSIADAMFAPVVWRFRTYGVDVADGARGWYETMLELPAMKAWERDAEAEVAAARARGVPARATPDPASAQHCFCVVFSSQLASPPPAGYAEAAEAMVELARSQPGFLGIESVRDASGAGITVSYWDSPQAIARFRAEERHRGVQRQGRETFYTRYEVRVCSVERGYKFDKA
jgi:glutathione S-transferase